jgi:hypothetical protein
MRRAALQLDFVAPRRRAHFVGVAVLAGALGLAGFLVLEHQAVQKRLQTLEASASLLGAPRPARVQGGVERRSQLEGEMKSARQ